MTKRSEQFHGIHKQQRSQRLGEETVNESKGAEAEKKKNNLTKIQ